MNLKAILMPFAMIVMAALAARANGDPVLRYSALERAAVPDPLDVPEIRIKSEMVKITHVDGYNCFDVTYQLVNKSAKDFPELHYGFPIDYLVADEQEVFRCFPSWISESSYMVGWDENLIKDVSFSLDGDVLPFEVSKESVREAGYMSFCTEDSLHHWEEYCDGINRRWFYTKLKIEPRAEVVLNVRYKVYANSSAIAYGNESDYFSRKEKGEGWHYYMDHGYYRRHFAGEFRIVYDFSPAKHFDSGRSFPIELEIDLSGVRNPNVNIDKYWVNADKITRYYYSGAGEIEPLSLDVLYERDLSKEYCDSIAQMYALSTDGYTIKYKKDKITIDFKEPQFVTEVVCDIDTTRIQSFETTVTYSDGRKKEVKELHSTSRESIYPERNFLIITDMVSDGWYHKKSEVRDDYDVVVYDLDTFKVKSITFTFPEGTSPKGDPAMKNLRPIDSRFIKQALK